MRKRSLSLILAVVVLAVSFTACSTPNEKVVPNTEKPTSSQGIEDDTLPTSDKVLKFGAEPINYSDLGLNLPEVTYPEIVGAEACLIAFTPEMLGEADMVVLAKVNDVRFNKYYYNGNTVCYDIEIIKSFYDYGEIKTDTNLTIECNLFTGSSIENASVGLKKGGVYILPIQFEQERYMNDYGYSYNMSEKLLSKEAQEKGIGLLYFKKMESGWSLIYQFMPQIQLVQDDYYLFTRRWGVKLATGATNVIEDEAQGFINELFIKQASDFLPDFENIVKQYCGKQKIALEIVTYPVIDGKIKTVEDVAWEYAYNQYEKDGQSGTIDSKISTNKSGEFVITLTSEKGKKYTYTVPEYFDAADPQTLIDDALKYFVFDANDYQVALNQKEYLNGYNIVEFSKDGKIAVRADFTTLGRFHQYRIYED